MDRGKERVRIVWTEFAEEDIKIIFEFLTTEQGIPIEIAERIVDSLFERVEQLLLFPRSGELDPFLEEFEKAHRHLVQGNYKIIYRVEKETVFIVSVFDTRQDPQKLIQRIKKSGQE